MMKDRSSQLRCHGRRLRPSRASYHGGRRAEILIADDVEVITYSTCSIMMPIIDSQAQVVDDEGPRASSGEMLQRKLPGEMPP